MEQLKMDQSERALLVGIIHGAVDQVTVEEQLDELTLLAETAGAQVVSRVTQRLQRLNPQYLIGKGKAKQIVSQARELHIQLIIFDDDLSPTQIKNYLNFVGDIKVIDRSSLILEIFRQHARSREAKTQVELAHLEYLLPRLSRQWTHLERQMGGIGTRAGMGETQIEIDRRLLRKRIAKLKQDLIKIDAERETQRKGRRSFFHAALVGYTNAGKSTLMRALSGADVFIQDQFFATLDTTVRQVIIDDTHPILLSDTVGFVRKLPHDLIASFRSTLKEVVDADLILIVIDACAPQIQEHYQTVKEVLSQLDAGEKKQLTVLNKIDQVHEEHVLSDLKRSFPDAILISARNKLRIGELLKAVRKVMDEGYETAEVEIPFANGKTISAIQDEMDILERNYTDDGVRFTIKGPKMKVRKIIDQLI